MQEALGTVDQTAFSRAAIDYAYSKTSSSSPAWPTRTRATTTCRDVQPHAARPRRSRYDGSKRSHDVDELPRLQHVHQLRRAEHAERQRRRVLERGDRAAAAGIAGLALLGRARSRALYARPRKRSCSSMKMTADVINVPQSRRTDPNVGGQYYESLAVLLPALRLRPPERGQGDEGHRRRPHPARGRHHLARLVRHALRRPRHAARARSSAASSRASARESYDYRVEWAPGVEPADASTSSPWSTAVMNVPGHDGDRRLEHIAARDARPAEINTAHTPDPDSPHPRERPHDHAARARHRALRRAAT